MKGRARLPIEPLSEQQWARVQERVFTAIDRMPRKEAVEQPVVRGRWIGGAGAWSAVAGAAALLALVIGQIVWQPVGQSTGTGEPSARTLAADPRANGLARPVPPSVGVPQDGVPSSEEPVEPVVVATAAEPRELALAGARVRLAPHTRLSYDAAHPASKEASAPVELKAGAAEFEVAPHPQHAPFLVQAGAVRVVVVGTVFRVSREGATTTVNVTRGAVRVEWPTGEQLVRAGESWSEASPPNTKASEEASPQAPRRHRAPRRSPSKRKRKAAASARRAQPSPRQQFEQAASLEATDPVRADALYARVAKGKSAWAPNALFGRARLHLEQRRTQSGLELLRSYLRRFPSGPNAHDARQLLQHHPSDGQ